jgi:hypothetical protein
MTNFLRSRSCNESEEYEGKEDRRSKFYEHAAEPEQLGYVYTPLPRILLDDEIIRVMEWGTEKRQANSKAVKVGIDKAPLEGRWACRLNERG